jgi:hypothetical protein
MRLGRRASPLTHACHWLLTSRAVRVCLLLTLADFPCSAWAAQPPQYDIALTLDVAQKLAEVRQRVTWTNPGPVPVAELLFNAHAHATLSPGPNIHLAKMLELVRVDPDDALAGKEPALVMHGVEVPALTESAQAVSLAHSFREDQTTLGVQLAQPLQSGETITVDLIYQLRLPEKMGRWGQWRGVTYLSGCLPTLALHDGQGWHPTPFVPWHQGVCHEAGRYRVRIHVPKGQVVACSGQTPIPRDVGNGHCELFTGPFQARDFALLTSDRYQEFVDEAGPVRLRCVAFPEHAEAARRMLKAAREALLAYADWYGPYPYPEFTIAETYLGWPVRACAGLSMIDTRVFALPGFAAGYAEYLVCQQVAQQWWHNLVGTDGYAEPYVDAGFSSYSANRLLDRKYGRNNAFFEYPRALCWLPGVHREDFTASLINEFEARGEGGPALQDLPKFEDPARWSALAAGRGGKIFGMIEARIGEETFLLFCRHLVETHHFGILRTADMQHELELLTNCSWDQFFQDWVYGSGLTDWCIDKVTLTALDEQWKTTILLQQKGEINEPTELGVCCEGEEGYPLRIPLEPDAGTHAVADPRVLVEPLSGGCYRVELWLPCRPKQITIDPDGILLDRNPANNTWKQEVCWHFTPLYTTLDENELNCAHNRWNILCGPWFYDPDYDDPWFTRAAVLGFRLGAVRSHSFQGGAYVGLRPEYGDIGYGADITLPNWPFPKTEVGFNVERSLAEMRPNAARLNRTAAYGRYIFEESSSFYLPPMHYLEVFAANQNRFLPLPRTTTPGAERFDTLSTLGMHYHLDLLTPYWDPDRGVRVDSTLAGGVPVLGETKDVLESQTQVSFAQSLPESLGWLHRTKLACRLYGAAALPDHGEFFSLGGNSLFRGFDLRERQGNAIWVGSVEWRVPILRELDWGCCGHALGLDQVALAPFYDVGAAYLDGHILGSTAHALGVGLRLDINFVSVLERMTLRFDVARTVNESTPVQFWFGIQHPF